MLSDKMLYTRRVASDAVMLVLALVFSYIEAILPLELLLPLPGFKLGLANIVITVLVWRISLVDAAVVSALRVLIMGLLFGTPVSMMFSFGGALLSFAALALLRGVGGQLFSFVGISVLSAAAHNLGQLICAGVLFGAAAILSYLPFLLIASAVFGTVSGLLLNALLPQLEKIKLGDLKK